MKKLKAIAIAILAMPLLLSQTFTGTISGVVTDPNAATVPGATVRARNEATGDTRQVQTGADGLYVFSQLPPGGYEVSVESRGFRKSVQTGAALVHYGSDFVFDGTAAAPYREEDAPNPRSVYATSKLLGE